MPTLPSRATFLAPGVILLFIAFVLSLLVSISLPDFSAMDIARTHFNVDFLPTDGNSTDGTEFPGEYKYGIWGYCVYGAESGSKSCELTGSGYPWTVSYVMPEHAIGVVFIEPSWTRGLVIHPVATIFIFLAFVISLSSNLAIELPASILSCLAALLTFAAFMADIAFLAVTQHRMSAIEGSHTAPGPGFWLTFVSWILLLAASGMVYIRRRRHHSDLVAKNNINGMRLGSWKEGA